MGKDSNSVVSKSLNLLLIICLQGFSSFFNLFCTCMFSDFLENLAN